MFENRRPAIETLASAGDKMAKETYSTRSQRSEIGTGSWFRPLLERLARFISGDFFRFPSGSRLLYQACSYAR